MHRISTSRWLHGDYVARRRGKKRNKEEERSTRKEEPVSRGFQPPQNDPSGLPVRLRLPPLCSPPAKALAPVHHLPTYLPIYLSTCFSLFYRLSLPFPLAQTCWPTYLIRLQGFELAAFLTEWPLDIPRGVNRWQNARWGRLFLWHICAVSLGERTSWLFHFPPWFFNGIEKCQVENMKSLVLFFFFCTFTVVAIKNSTQVFCVGW